MFGAAFTELLQHLSLPFLREVASDEYRHFGGLCSTIAAVGHAAELSEPPIRLVASQALMAFTMGPSEEQQQMKLPDTMQLCSNPSYNQQVLESSKVCILMAYIVMACIVMAARHIINRSSRAQRYDDHDDDDDDDDEGINQIKEDMTATSLRAPRV